MARSELIPLNILDSMVFLALSFEKLNYRLQISTVFKQKFTKLSKN